MKNNVLLNISGLFPIIFRKQIAISMGWWPTWDPSTYPLNRIKGAGRWHRMEPTGKFLLQKVCFYMSFHNPTEEHIYFVWRGEKTWKNCIFDVFQTCSGAQYASPFPFYLGPQLDFDRTNTKFSLSTKIITFILVYFSAHTLFYVYFNKSKSHAIFIPPEKSQSLPWNMHQSDCAKCLTYLLWYFYLHVGAVSAMQWGLLS